MNDSYNKRIPEGYPNFAPSIWEEYDFDHAQDFLSFITSAVLLKTTGTEDWNSDSGEAVLAYRQPYDQLYFRDRMQVYGDGVLIYAGLPEAPTKVYTGDLSDADGVNYVRYPRPIYNGIVEYTRGTEQYRVVGILTRFAARQGNNYYANGYDWLFLEVNEYQLNEANSNTCPQPVIQSYSDNEIRAYVTKYTRSSETDPWIYSTKLDNTFTLSTLDAYGFIFEGTLYRKSGTSWVSLGSSGAVPIYDNEITSISLNVSGYYACWDEDLIFRLGFSYNAGEFDGDFRRYFPSLPTDCGDDNWPVHPYTTITIKRNNPEPQSFTNPVAGAHDTQQQRIFFRISKESEPERYRCINKIDNIYKLVPPVAGTLGTFPVYDDSYGQSGTTYSIAGTSHTLITKTEYTTNKNSFDYRIINHVINLKKFNKTTTYGI